MIIIEPCAGLGNKLLGMSSAYAVAQKLNRELIVMWKREVGCNVKAEELFDLPFRVIEISENQGAGCAFQRESVKKEMAREGRPFFGVRGCGSDQKTERLRGTAGSHREGASHLYQVLRTAL